MIRSPRIGYPSRKIRLGKYCVGRETGQQHSIRMSFFNVRSDRTSLTYTVVVVFTPFLLYVIVSIFLPAELVEGGLKPSGASAKIVDVVVVSETVLIMVTMVKAVKVPEALMGRHSNFLT